MNSKLISIGLPLTPIAQDDSWADQPQESPRAEETPVTPPPQVTTPVIDSEDFEAQPTPSPQASPAFRRLRKGPRPQVTLSSVPEGEERQSVSREVFPEASPTVNIPESEAKAAEDIPTASADEEEEPHNQERAATPPSNHEVVHEENVSNPPVPEVEVTNTEAATNINTEANDVVMAEDNVAPEANVLSEANVQPEPQSMLKLLFHPQGLTLLSRHMIAANLSLSDGLFWFLPQPPDHNMTSMWSRGHKFRSQSPGYQGFQVLLLHQDPSVIIASEPTTPSSIAPRILTRSQRSLLELSTTQLLLLYSIQSRANLSTHAP